MQQPSADPAGAPAGDTPVGLVVRFLETATTMLAEAREEVDALNVFPVPDGDTGTNMYLTLCAARDAARDQDLAAAGAQSVPSAPTTERALWQALGRGALLGARGNSGVILSQMLSAVGQSLTAATGPSGAGETLATALTAGSRAGREAVGSPTEGTILSVAAAAAEAATAAAVEVGPHASGVRRVVTAAVRGAEEALRRTPEQLPVLADAGVVDAGGRGLVVVLAALEHVLTGRRTLDAAGRGHHRIPVPRGGPAAPPAEQAGGSFEVVYVLEVPADDADAADEAVGDTGGAVAALRTRLGELGDSLVVSGGGGLWKVHVHVDEAGAAVEAGLAAGALRDISITHLAPPPDPVAAERDGDPSAEPRTPAPPGQAGRTGRAVVAVAAGEGLARLFTDAGASVVAGGPGRRPSAGDLLRALEGCGAAEVVLLPNDRDSVATAELAASEIGGRGDGPGGVPGVVVIPTTSQLEGLAALAVHEPGRSLAADVLEMTATARHVRQGAVTIAARRAITMGGPCEPGDALGVIAGDFAVVGDDLAGVAREVVERLLGGGGDLVTVVTGAAEDGRDPAALGAGLAAYVEEQHPTVDVVVYDGGQERYPLLIAVE